MDTKKRVIEIFPSFEPYWAEISRYFSIKKVAAKTPLLEAGDISKYMFIVVKGCLRIFIIRDDGREVTVQFFFEKQMVASMESAFTGKPGKLYLEAIEDSELIVISIRDFKGIFRMYDQLKDLMIDFLQRRLLYYSELFTSFILNTPEERYIRLMEENPGIIERIPHYYIATYLGITPVSLSRIRSRLSKKNEH